MQERSRARSSHQWEEQQCDAGHNSAQKYRFPGTEQPCKRTGKEKGERIADPAYRENGRGLGVADHELISMRGSTGDRMLLAVKVMNQTNQMKTRNRKAFPRSEPNFFTATIYLRSGRNAIFKCISRSFLRATSTDYLLTDWLVTTRTLISRPFPSVSRGAESQRKTAEVERERQGAF